MASTPGQGFEAAIDQDVSRTMSTLKDVGGCWGDSDAEAGTTSEATQGQPGIRAVLDKGENPGYSCSKRRNPEEIRREAALLRRSSPRALFTDGA